MRGIESANLLLSRAVRGRSPVFGRSVDAGAVAGRAARAWPRVLYGAVLGLSITGDGASFNAASAASVATDVRWKKFTGIFGQPFHLTCRLCSAKLSAVGPRPARFCVVEDSLAVSLRRAGCGGLLSSASGCKTLATSKPREWHRRTSLSAGLGLR